MKTEPESRTIRVRASATACYVAPSEWEYEHALADAMACMKEKYDGFMRWLAGFDMDGDDVARIKAELPELWADFRATSDEVDQAWTDVEEELFDMALGHMKDVIAEMTAGIGIDAPEGAEEDSAEAVAEETETGVPAAGTFQ